MPLPASFARVLALLKRISPLWPSTAVDKSVGKELGSIAVAMGMATDPLDGVLDELLPDTTTQLIYRWEAITRVASRSSDPIATRRSKVLSVLRRISGARIDQLEKVLTGSLALDPEDMVWVEQLRSFIEVALTETTGVVSLAVPTTAPGLSVSLGRPWPGIVDDAGVQVYIAISSVGTTVATLTSPAGTSWTIPVNATSGWYFTRSIFTGQPAGGMWTLSIRDSSAPTLTEFRLLVSNNIDSGQIYNFFILRDFSLPGTADLVEAQRLFHRTALGNMRAFVVERLSFVCGDPHSLIGRDPLGGPFELPLSPLLLDLSSSSLPSGLVSVRTGSTIYAARGASIAALVASGGIFEDYGFGEGGGWWTFKGFSNRCTKPFDHTVSPWSTSGTNTLTPAAIAGPAAGGPSADLLVDMDATFPSRVTFDLADSARCTDSFWVKDGTAGNAPTNAGGLLNGDLNLAYPAGSSSGWVRGSSGHEASVPATPHTQVVSGFVPPGTFTNAATGGRYLWGDSQVLGWSDLPLVDGTTSDCSLQVQSAALPALISGGDVDLRARYLADYLDNPQTTNQGGQDGGWVFSVQTPQGLFGVRYDIVAGLGNSVFVLVAKGADLLSLALDSFPGGGAVDVRLTYKPSTLTAALTVGYNGGFQQVIGVAGATPIGTPTACWVGSNLGSSTGIMPRRWQRFEAMTTDWRDFEGVVLGDSITANFDGLFLMGASTVYTAAQARTRAGILSFSQPFRTIDDEKTLWDASLLKGRASLKFAILQVGFNNNVIAGESSSTILTKLTGLVADINASNPTAQVLLGPLTPAKASFIGGQYATWLAVNAGIAGGSVTGSNLTILSAWSALNDGSDNLKSQYDQLGDHTHPNNAGRLAAFGVTWPATLHSLGIL